MADEKVRDPLETPPPALVERVKTIVLQSGKTVILEKWSWSKLWDLTGFAGNPEKIPAIAVESVRTEDRAAVEAMSMEDQLEVATAAVEWNMPGNTGKNLIALANAWRRLTREGEKTEAPAAATP